MVPRHGLHRSVRHDGSGEHSNSRALGNHHATSRILGRTGTDVTGRRHLCRRSWLHLWIEPVLLVLANPRPRLSVALWEVAPSAARAAGTGGALACAVRARRRLSVPPVLGSP